MTDTFTFDAFLSYRRSDGQATARWLRQRLIQYRPPEGLSNPRREPLRVFLDTVYERATDDFFDKNIRPSLQQSRYLIVVCTPEAFTPRPDGSESWVAREVDVFVNLAQGGNVIPVLAGTGTTVPEVLRRRYPNLQFVDLRNETRGPWWRLGRRQHDDDECLKIVAALLQVPAAEMPVLRREESMRRQRQRRFVGALAAVALLSVSGLAAWALHSLVAATEQLVRNHTLQGRQLFEESPGEARLRFAEAVKTAESFALARIGVKIDARDARLWLAQYPASGASPVILWNSGAITAAAFSADAARLAVGTLAGEVTVWDTTTWKQIGKTLRHGAHVECVTFSPDAALVATAGRNKRVLTWDVASGDARGKPIEHEDYAMWAAFDPTGQTIASVGADGSAKVTTLGTGTQMPLNDRPGNSKHHVQFSIDGTRLLTSSSDGTARLWNASSGQQIASLDKGQSHVVEFSRDGRFVLTSGVPRVWDGATGAPLGAPVKHERVTVARFSPKGDLFATAGWDRTVRVWDRQTLGQVSKLMLHPAPVHLVAWSHDGRLLASADSRRTVRVWDAERGELLATPVQHDDEVVYLSFLHERKLVSASSDGTTRIIDVAGIDREPWNLPDAATAELFPDGNLIVAASRRGRVAIWDIHSRARIGEDVVVGAGVSKLAISADGARLATLSGNVGELDKNWSVALWDLTHRQRIGAWLKPPGGVSDVVFSPDHKRVLLQGLGNEAYLADGDTGRLFDVRLVHPVGIARARFSPDGKLLATAGRDGTVQLWDSAGRPIGSPLNHPSSILDMAFSADGRYLATGTNAYDSSARVWDVRSQTLVGSVLPHSGPVISVRFDPAGRRLVTGAADSLARLWDIPSGRTLGRPMRHGKSVRWVEFSPDGRLVATGSADGTARVWNSESGEPVTRAMEHGARPIDEVSNSSLGVDVARFSANGDVLLTLAADQSARLWDLRSSAKTWQVLSVGAEVETLQQLDEATGSTRTLGEAEWTPRRDELEKLLRLDGEHRKAR